MSEHRVSKRYAKSMLDFARENNLLDEIKADMALVQSACSVSGPFRAMLKNPEIQSDKKFNVLKALFEKKVNKITLTFFEILVRKRRERYLNSIAVEFHNLYNIHKGIQETHITTTFKIGEELRSEFNRIAAEISGKKPEITEHVDKEIIGGFILKVDDRQLDSSLRSKLNELKIKLTN